MPAGASADLVVVGAIAGAHGVRGEVRVKSFTADPDDLFAYGPLLDADGAVLIEARSVRPAKAHHVVMPAGPARQREEWEALKGTRLHVPRAALPPTEADEFYVEDLVGLAALDPGGNLIGRVRAVQDFGAGDLLEIQPEGGGRSVFIPFTQADVPDLDLAAGQLVIADWDTWASEDGAADEAPPDDALPD